MTTRTPTNLRVLTLFLELLSCGAGLTKSRLRRLEGYRDLGEAAFESAFMRDKNALRDAGIVLDVDGTDGAERYRVSDTTFPEHAPDLTPVDIALIDMAVAAWSPQGAPRSQAVHTKLVAAATAGPRDPGAPALMDLEGASRVADVLEALEAGVPVSFTYTSASGTQERAVEPWRLVLRGRALYLWGLDLDRGAPRLFRISRMSGDIETVGEPGDARVPSEALPDPFDALVVSPRLWVREGSAPEVRLHATTAPRPDDAPTPPDGFETMQGEPEDMGEWIAHVLADMEDVVVLEPRTLRDAVLQRLRAAATWEEDHDA